MFCPNCGNNVADGQKFCPTCGASMIEAVNAINAAEQEELAKRNKDINLRGKIAVVFTAIGLVLGIVMTIIDLVNGKGLGSFIDGFGAALILAGVIPGLCHFSELFKKISGFLILPIMGWLMAFSACLMVCGLGGAIYMLVDLFRYLKLRKQTVGDNAEQ